MYKGKVNTTVKISFLVFRQIDGQIRSLKPFSDQGQAIFEIRFQSMSRYEEEYYKKVIKTSEH